MLIKEVLDEHFSVKQKSKETIVHPLGTANFGKKLTLENPYGRNI